MFQGYIQNSEIDGTIQMKSYLTGTPEIRLALNEDLAIGKEFGGTGDLGMVLLDDCNFHESVRLDSFDVDRTLVLVSKESLVTAGAWTVLAETSAGERRKVDCKRRKVDRGRISGEGACESCLAACWPYWNVIRMLLFVGLV